MKPTCRESLLCHAAHSMKILCLFLIFLVAGSPGAAFTPPTNEPDQKKLTEKEVSEGEGKLLSRTRKLTFAGKRSGEGYFSANGSMDTCIVLRSAVVKDGVMHFQAGGGVVADSDPEAEYQETVAKSRALVRAAEEAVRFASATNTRPSVVPP